MTATNLTTRTNNVHYKQLLDPGKFLQPSDFTKDTKITISRISREDLPARDKEDKQSAPMLYMLGRDKKEYARPFKVPKSVLYGLSLLLGTETDAWVGKEIVLFPAFCMSFGDREECLRVRFPADVENKIRKWLKKRKASPSCYILDERREATQAPTAPLNDAEATRQAEHDAAVARGEA